MVRLLLALTLRDASHLDGFAFNWHLRRYLTALHIECAAAVDSITGAGGTHHSCSVLATKGYAIADVVQRIVRQNWEQSVRVVQLIRCVCISGKFLSITSMFSCCASPCPSSWLRKDTQMIICKRGTTVIVELDWVHPAPGHLPRWWRNNDRDSLCARRPPVDVASVVSNSLRRFKCSRRTCKWAEDPAAVTAVHW